MSTALGSIDQEELIASLPSIVTGLLSDDEAPEAASRLAAIVDRAEGVAAEAVGQSIRDFGAMEPLLELLERPETQQDALRVLGNLASNAVDVHAAETKRLLHELGAFPRVLPLIHSPVGPTVVYALGAVQNMLVRTEYALHMQDVGAEDRLNAIIAKSPDEVQRHFAKGCLSNMQAVLAPNFRVQEDSAPRRTPTQRRWAEGGGGGGASSSHPAGAALIRVSVPADNNCLFTTSAYLCAPAARDLPPGSGRLVELARRLRRECAQHVRKSADRDMTLALVGFENAEAYGAWIEDETHWGGEPEVSMLAGRCRPSPSPPHPLFFLPSLLALASAPLRLPRLYSPPAPLPHSPNPNLTLLRPTALPLAPPRTPSCRPSARLTRCACTWSIRSRPTASSLPPLLHRSLTRGGVGMFTPAELFDVEIVVAACGGAGRSDAASILRYSGDRNRRVVYVLYTGQHYDPLVGPPPGHTKLFAPEGDDPKASAVREAAALEIAARHAIESARLAAERSLPAGSLPNSPAI